MSTSIHDACAREMVQLGDAYFKSAQSPFEATRLMNALGCRHLSYRARRFKAEALGIVESSQPDMHHADLVRNLLRLTILHHANGQSLADDGSAIIDGLSRDGRWRACLDDLAGAYALTYVLLDFARYARNLMPRDVSASASLAHAVSPGCCGLLNEWLKPAVAFEALPSERDLITHLFGDAWYEFVFVENARFATASQVVRRCQPPFLPGLALNGEHYIGQDLPELHL